MRHYFQCVRRIKEDYPDEAEDMLDLYSCEVLSWWGNWHEDTQDKILKEFTDFYDSIEIAYPSCIEDKIE